MTAAALGFDRPCANSLDAVSDRDFALEYLSAAAIAARASVALRRGNRDLVQRPVRLHRLSDAFTTGSSIMPQKKNPDAAELTRAKTGRVVGALVALLTVMKGLPLAYAKDMQEDKEPVFDATAALGLSLAATAGMVRDLQADAGRMRALAGSGYATATDLADWLVRVAGLPFRTAHHVTGRLVARAEAAGLELQDLPLAAMTGRRAGDPGGNSLGTVGGRIIGVAHQPGRYRAGERRGPGPTLDKGIIVTSRAIIPALLALCAALAACGKLGPPAPPGPADQITYPKVLPNPLIPVSGTPTAAELLAARPAFQTHALDGLLYEGVPPRRHRSRSTALPAGSPAPARSAPDSTACEPRCRASISTTPSRRTTTSPCCPTLAALGAGADVVSLGELRRALHAGIAPAQIVFSRRRQGRRRTPRSTGRRYRPDQRRKPRRSSPPSQPSATCRARK